MTAKPTPQAILNRAGLPSLRARAGTHADFLESLRRGLADANRPGLSELQSRDGDDFTLGLFDAWAAVLDTLTFYAERQANEAYLRTATRRDSIRAHARLIGYELAPAKAASVHLAFEAQPHDAPEATLEYPSGLQVRSIPRDGQLPQLFETVEPLSARAEWNAMRPLMAWPQVLTRDAEEIQLTAAAPRLNRGDPLLLMQGDVPVPTGTGSDATFLRRVSGVADGLDGRRVVALKANPASPAPYVFQPLMLALWLPGTAVSTLSLVATLAGHAWSVATLAGASNAQGLSPGQVRQAVQASDFRPEGEVRPHLLKIRAGFFGNNAPSGLLTAQHLSVSSPGYITDTATAVGGTPPGNRAWLYLDREYPEITPGRGLLLRDATHELWVRVHAAEAQGVEAYGLTARVTRLETDDKGLSPQGGAPVAISDFSTRGTTALALPEPLALSDLPITDPVGQASGALGADQIELGTPELLLKPGKTLAITGERADLAGVATTEIRQLVQNVILQDHSLLTLNQPLAHRYRRDTVRVLGNVALATHGETVAEVLGDGDATRTFQSFTLKSGPLTHVSARNARGMAPAIELRVNRVRWDLVEDFRASGPHDRVFILRIDEDGSTRVVFGDGIRGARLPTGQGNVEALYRRGAGLAGHLEAGQLSLLATKPAGLKGVTNPLPPSGGADAERLEQARRNAPMGVLTLGRAVSLRDYEDFARGFASVAKARADWTFDGFARPITITVAGQEGGLLPETGDDMQNLRAALAAAGESDLRVSVRNYQPVGFGLRARLFADPAFMPEDVIAGAQAAVLAAFSFDARELGQGVSQAQVIAALQSAPGVLGVDLDALHTGTTEALQPRLAAAVGRPDLAGAPPVAAELLVLDPARLHLEVAA
ncbi:putative baseplate assembly protein [Paracoccus aminovorans]|uniref:Putative baseplate assembly protein n=1 Tax=Paracoccus aminovorans TaxID=34004 RepID=A0A1I3ATP3_9RHOB|nr:putative baseplate assembly protein [Paracoccus aminovorans]CQR86513.1 putative phage tail region protein [Paracoccus aminovorans]SFH53374.1 putative baseplate assembly protein [Paracoccus aminovorans]